MKPSRILAVSVLTLALAACNNFSFTKERIEYETSSSRSPLMVPPELDNIPVSDRYEVPERQSVLASASADTTAGGDKRVVKQEVLPEGKIATVKREGNTRWVAVNLDAQKTWDLVLNFWHSVGLDLEKSDASVGTMQTVWAENKANLPQDFIRKTLGKVLDSVYSTGERDQYRARLEKAGDNLTNVYITHRSMVEVLVKGSGDQQDIKWQVGPSDPELEAEMLTRLSQDINAQFGIKAPAATSAEHVKEVEELAKPVKTADICRLVNDSEGKPAVIDVNEDFERAWRRAALAMDRLGFEIEDRDRSQGVFFIRYLDENYEKEQKDSQGFWAKFTGRGDSVDAVKYIVHVRPVAEKETQVMVLGGDGKEDTTGVAPTILKLLYSQMR